MNKNNDMYYGLVSEHGSPLLVFNPQEVRDCYREITEALPGVEMFYAVKCNNDKNIMKVLKEVGCSFDVATVTELKLCYEFGVGVNQIIYSHPIKSPKEVAGTVALGINTFVVDNESESVKLPEGSNIIIRVKTFEYQCVSNLSKKFGCELSDVVSLAKYYRERKFNIVGCCFHVGSQICSNQAYVDMLVALKPVYDELEAQGFKLSLLDIGGGFPSEWDIDIDIYDFCAPIREHLAKDFNKYKIMAEPGRFLANSSYTLLYKVIGKSIRNNRTWYYVDEGVYGTFSAVTCDKANVTIKALKESDHMASCVISGQTCDSADVISEDTFLPLDLEIGDILVTEQIGAYSMASATTFNGFDLTKVIVLN
ncbi:MAG: type III PLP-dependent enzyme [Sedimentisphaerales bacterium]|nr:type III PLP-dependent enzyme [Sedimentisphaerales bacterium]